MNEPETATMSARGRRVWLGVGAVLTVAALLLGGMGVVSAGWSAFQSTATETRSESYARPVSRVEVGSVLGSVSLSGTDSHGIDVRRELTWSGPEPEVGETWADDTFAVETVCPDRFPQWVSRVCSVDYSAQVPADTDVEVNTTTAPIDMRGFGGELALTSTTGPITVDDAVGPLSAGATTGDITGTDLRSARVDAQVRTGDLELSFTEPPDRVTATSTTGEVTIEVPRADGPYRVDVQTSTGEQRVDVAQDPDAEPDRRIDVTSTTGDVHIRYAS